MESNLAAKECFKCKTVKPLSEFYRHKGMADKYLNKCKSCTKSDVQSYYGSTREGRVSYEKRREQNPDRKAKKLEYQKAMRIKHPLKYKARSIVSNALRSGALHKPATCRCGGANPQAHHHDYSKPLEVDWLCRKCHLAEHGKVAYRPSV